VLTPSLRQLRKNVEAELTQKILPFWLKHTLDHERGGFIGRIGDGCVPDPHAEKSLILNTRILWTFSRAYRFRPQPEYLQTAKRAFAYITHHFLDEKFGGFFWMLDCDGTPTDMRKCIYGQAFTLYAIAEYSRATGDPGSMATAQELMKQIEATAHDPLHGGYFETYERDWTLAMDQRLSDVDMDEKRSQNTHLHMMEACATLLRVQEDFTIRARLQELIEIFLDRILNPANHHMQLFFDEDWKPQSKIISYGHDIEGSWLLLEAAEVLGNKALLERVRPIAVQMAQAVYDEALDPDGGILYEGSPEGIRDSNKHWWPQAEAVVGFLNAWQLSGQPHFREAAVNSWSFIEENIIDRQYGEWFWMVNRDRVPAQGFDKVGPWKCPYHNSRACFEVMERLDAGIQLTANFPTLKTSSADHCSLTTDPENPMNSSVHKKAVQKLFKEQEKLLSLRNHKAPNGNGIFDRWVNPVVTAAHAPILWRYDLDPKSNPFLMERLGINAAFNAGAIYHEGKFLLVARVEGADRKSFFAVAESPNGVDNFRFWDYPLRVPQTSEIDTNVYDMRLTKHEDGWIYGLFCTERKDPAAPEWETTSAIAQCGILRTRDLKIWERLPDLKSKSPQQRNVVLHPEFVDGKYAFYTRPQDDFIQTGKGGGIGWGLAECMENAMIEEEKILDNREYHTIQEVKNGQGPAPIKTRKGWLHLAHGVRNTAAGLRYVLYLFLTELERPWVVTHKPAGYFLAPVGEERVGDVSNVVFSNGWIVRPKGRVYIYYASSDTRLHVATSTVDQLLDYVLNTPADPLASHLCVAQRCELIQKNLELLGTSKNKKSKTTKTARTKKNS